MVSTQELAERIGVRILEIAIQSGATPCSALKTLSNLQEAMVGAIRTGELERAIELADKIGVEASQERQIIDKKWEIRFQRGYEGNPFDDPEYLNDTANLKVLDMWLEKYGQYGEYSAILRGYSQAPPNQ